MSDTIDDILRSSDKAEYLEHVADELKDSESCVTLAVAQDGDLHILSFEMDDLQILGAIELARHAILNDYHSKE